MRKIILILLALPVLSMAQSKLSFAGSGGILFVKNDKGQNYELLTSYKASQNIAVNLKGMYANLKNDHLNGEYNFKKIAVTAEYFFTPNSFLGFSSNVGFSYISFDKKLGLNHNDGIGLELGVITTFNIDKHFDYGFILNSTYTNISPGGILQSNLFLKYNL